MDRINALLRRVTHSIHIRSDRTDVSTVRGPEVLHVGNAPSPGTRDASLLRGRGVVPADPLADFEVLPQHAGVLVNLLNESRRALDPAYGMSLAAHEQRALDHFYSTRTALIEKLVSGHWPESVVSDTARGWPDISSCRTQKEILKTLLRDSPGLIIAEAHSIRSSKQLVIEQPNTLHRLGVKTLYLEHLQTIHQPDLDRHHRTGVMSEALSRFLAQQDSGHRVDVAHGQGFKALVQAAQRAGIRVVALDMMTSYHLRGAALSETAREDPTVLRVKLFNAVATRRILHDQQARAASGSGQRWIALMGNSHAGSYNGIAGVADRLGVPSLRVEDASGDRPGLNAGFDPGRTVHSCGPTDGGDIQCDFLIKVPCPGHSAVHTPEPCTEAQTGAARTLRVAIGRCAADVRGAGTYRLVEVTPGDHVLVHRSGGGELIAQHIVPVERGGVRLQLAEDANPARWAHMDRVFPDLAHLQQALNTRLDEAPRAAQV